MKDLTQISNSRNALVLVSMILCYYFTNTCSFVFQTSSIKSNIVTKESSKYIFLSVSKNFHDNEINGKQRRNSYYSSKKLTNGFNYNNTQSNCDNKNKSLSKTAKRVTLEERDKEVMFFSSKENDYPSAYNITIPPKTADTILNILPLIICNLAFFNFESTYYTVLRVTEFLTYVFFPYNEISYSCAIGDVSPIANGIVVTSIALLFATLISVTISSLRDRIRDLRIHVNNESTLLQELYYTIDSLTNIDTDTKISCLTYLERYIERIIAESQPRLNVLDLSVIYSELNYLMQQIDTLPTETLSSQSNPMLIERIYKNISVLKESRNVRVGELRSNFPLSNFITLAALGFSICIIFFINASCMILSNNIMILRVFWAVITGTFTLLSTTIFDLRDPFRGAYAVSTSQYYLLRDTIIDELDEIRMSLYGLEEKY